MNFELIYNQASGLPCMRNLGTLEADALAEIASSSCSSERRDFFRLLLQPLDTCSQAEVDFQPISLSRRMTMASRSIVDADGHVQEKYIRWADNLEKPYRSQSPRVVRDKPGVDVLMAEGKLWPKPGGLGYRLTSILQ